MLRWCLGWRGSVAKQLLLEDDEDDEDEDEDDDDEEDEEKRDVGAAK